MDTILISKEEKFILTLQIGLGATSKCYQGYKYSLSNPYQKKEEEKTNIYAIKVFDSKKEEIFNNEVNILKILSDSSINKNINESKDNYNSYFFPKIYYSGQGSLLTLKSNINSSLSSFSDVDSESTEFSYNQESVYFIVTDYFQNGELFDYIKTACNKGFSENISCKIFSKIVYAVKYLHSKNITHCDIKPENILLDNNFFPKLIDFGFSKHFLTKDEKLYNFYGTCTYCSYEAKNAVKNSLNSFNGIKNDLFSLGVLLFVLTLGEFPFQNASKKDFRYSLIIREKYSKFWEKYKGKIMLSEEFKDLVNKLICFNVDKRIGVDEILKHPWMKKYKVNISEENENINKMEEFLFWKEDEDDVINELRLRKIIVNSSK